MKFGASDGSNEGEDDFSGDGSEGRSEAAGEKKVRQPNFSVCTSENDWMKNGSKAIEILDGQRHIVLMLNYMAVLEHPFNGFCLTDFLLEIGDFLCHRPF